MYCDWFTTNSLNTKDPLLSQVRRPHLFTFSAKRSIGIHNLQRLPNGMPATAKKNGSRGIHLPRSTQADHSRHVCGNEFTCSAHGCFKGTSQQESIGNSHSQNIKISRVFVLCFLL